MEDVCNKVLCNLKLGVIQPFQIEEQLRLTGISSFEIQKKKTEILEMYQKSYPYY